MEVVGGERGSTRLKVGRGPRSCRLALEVSEFPIRPSRSPPASTECGQFAAGRRAEQRSGSGTVNGVRKSGDVGEGRAVTRRRGESKPGTSGGAMLASILFSSFMKREVERPGPAFGRGFVLLLNGRVLERLAGSRPRSERQAGLPTDVRSQ